MKAAMAARDSKAMAALLTADFRSEDVTGKVQTGNEMVQQVSAMPKDPNRVSETTVLSVRVVGNAATVRQRYHMTTSKTGPDGATHPVELTSVSTDTWVMTEGVWLLRQTVTDQLDYNVDGRVVAHRERGGEK
jgi:hypothetical protein